MRILSGIQPSGSLHLGNYFGMMKRMIRYQRDHDLFCFIVNYHALTTQPEAKELSVRTLEAAADFMALGLNPDKTVFWVQSDVPEVTELTWILSNSTGMGLLERCHSYKDKVAQGLKPSHGLFAYPVLMTADILLMRGERIPVGPDQKQHLEVARDIAESFNFKYGEVFKVPEPDITGDDATVPGLDGRKMSKSYGNTIGIFASKEEIKKKVMSIKTDSTPVDQPKPTKDNPLYEIYIQFLDDAGKKSLKERFEKPGLRYGDVKKELAEVIQKEVEPYRARRDELSHKPDIVKRALKEGAEKARVAAAETLKKARHAVGLEY